MSLAGNHEIEYDPATGNAFQGFRNRYRMPQVRPEEITCPFAPNSCTPSVYFSCYNYGNAFYSFDASTVHVLMLATYTYSNVTSQQYAWIEQDLAGVDRKVTPWVIVFMHAPFYNSNTAHQNEVRRRSFSSKGWRGIPRAFLSLAYGITITSAFCRLPRIHPQSSAGDGHRHEGGHRTAAL